MKTKLNLSLLFASSLLLFCAAETKAQAVRPIEQAAMNRATLFVPQGQCTITGVIRKDKSGYATKVVLYHEDAPKKPILSQRTRVGRYTFPVVPVGQYLVRPEGNLPSGLGYFDYQQKVTCEPNGHLRVDFKVDSIE